LGEQNSKIDDWGYEKITVVGEDLGKEMAGGHRFEDLEAAVEWGKDEESSDESGGTQSYEDEDGEVWLGEDGDGEGDEELWFQQHAMANAQALEDRAKRVKEYWNKERDQMRRSASVGANEGEDYRRKRQAMALDERAEAKAELVQARRNHRAALERARQVGVEVAHYVEPKFHGTAAGLEAEASGFNGLADNVEEMRKEQRTRVDKLMQGAGKEEE